MARVVRALIGAAALLAVPTVLSACGGRAHMPPVVSLGHAAARGQSAAGPSTPSSDTSGTGTEIASPTTTSSALGTPKSAAPSLPSGGSPSDPGTSAMRTAYETYLLDLSGLDDSLNKVWVDRIASVTTNRLAQASIRQAASLLAAQEHGVGVLRDDHVNVVITGPSSAALVDCQDEYHFYLVDDNSGTPDPFIGRGYFAGSAQMVEQKGHWLVDVFSTTHATCTY